MTSLNPTMASNMAQYRDSPVSRSNADLQDYYDGGIPVSPSSSSAGGPSPIVSRPHTAPGLRCTVTFGSVSSFSPSTIISRFSFTCTPYKSHSFNTRLLRSRLIVFRARRTRTHPTRFSVPHQTFLAVVPIFPPTPHQICL